MGAAISRVAWMFLLALVLGACSPTRPSIETWSAVWLELESLVPNAEEFEAASGRKFCNELLVAVKERRAALLPAPDLAIEPPIRAWLEAAGRLAFECPAASHQEEQFRQEVRELRILTDEVSAGIQGMRDRTFE